jgi:flagellar biosynthesis GTPase FlhF
MSKYGHIKNAVDLQELQNKCEPGEIAVGFTDSNTMYIKDEFSTKTVHDEEAKRILDINDEQLALLKKTGGRHVFEEAKDEVEELVLPEEEPQIQASPEQTEVVEEKVEEQELANVTSEPEIPEIEKVEISKEEYDRLLEVQEHEEFLEDQVDRLKKALDEKNEEYDALVQSIRLIKSI